MTDRGPPTLSALLAEGALERLGDAISGLLYVYDVFERRHIYVNRALSELLGVSPDALRDLGDSFVSTIVHPADAAAVVEHYASVARETQTAPLSIEFHVRSETGRLHVLSASETLLSPEPGGAARYVLGVAHDLTGRVAGEDTLRVALRSLQDSEQRWRSIVENPFDFIVIIDREYKFTYMNFPAPGLREEELIGKMGPLDFVEPGERARIRAAYDRVFENGKPTTYEAYVPHLEKWFSNIVSPVRQNGAVVQVSVLTREITFEKKLEAERVAREEELSRKNAELEQALAQQRALEAKLTQSAKLEAVGRLAGGIAHDFNNLLTGISGVVALVAQRLPSNDSLRADIVELQQAVERGAGLTRQLLAFSRQQLVVHTALDLNDIVQDSTRMLSRLIGENIELEFERAPDLWSVNCNRSQIEQILMNLVVNARDAMPNGGKLLLEIKNVELDASYCEVQPDAAVGNFVRLCVSDTGTGMDAATQARIFEPFFTTKPVGTGTGLGLATVYGIVRQGGGFIHVYSELGHGTAFKIYWPAVEAQRAVSSAPPRERPHGEETILVVEDEHLVLRLVRRMLQSLGYSVLTARRGDEALTLIESGIEFDLLLTDVILPGYDGHTLFKRATALRPGLVAVFMSGYTDDFIASKGVLEAGGHFLQKPFTPAELAGTVRKALDARPVAQDQVAGSPRPERK
ncbi:MAG TPA: PAS domain S-box protein [Polyangiaceae bacterium]